LFSRRESQKLNNEQYKLILLRLEINRFENESSTVSALKKLHQLDILGSKLVVVYAKKKSDDWTEVPGDEESGKNRCTISGVKKIF
jgi:hypothetical protein